MKYVLFATPRFGALVLTGLVERGMPPVVVVTNPDRPAGRDQVFTPPPAKLAAIELGIPFLQPEKLADAHQQLADISADAFVVAAYGKILKPDLLAIPPRGTVGVHPSLLPLYRGPSPMQQALLDGAQETGVSLFLVDEDVDHGPVLAEERVRLDGSETYSTLEASLADIGAGLVFATLPNWVAGDVEPREQEHERATTTAKFMSSDAYVPWKELVRAQGDREVAERIVRMVSALNPEPGVWTERGDTRIKLLKARVEAGGLTVTEHQVAGKKPSLEELKIS